MKYILIDAQTAASTATIAIANRATVVSKGLAGAETIAVNVLIGSTYDPLIDGGEAVTLTPAQPHLIISGPGTYQFAKGVTAGAVTLQVTD